VNNVVDSIIICKDKDQLEARFLEDAKDQRITVTDEDMDNGYVETKYGSICMSWAEEAQ
jgi:hypothetical protein